MKHPRAGTVVVCHARGCRNRVEWGTKQWTANWSYVWVEEANMLLDSCSRECSAKIRGGSYFAKKRNGSRNA